ncbi:MAG TPA: GAF domain-containing protein, partial [Xenococcaceae cyanobacterium]
VAAGYPRALNKTISDPCFEVRYLEKYRDGRVRAIDNIYEAGMTHCYIEQLESLEVKANLVTPILNEGKLFGLLVAHQCAQPRHWQDYEIRWVTQIATQVGFALDNAKLLNRLKTEGIPTKLLNNFTLGIRDSLNPKELLKIAVEQARKLLKCDRAIVYQFDANWYGTIIAESVALGYPRALNSQIQDPCFARDYAEKYRQGRVKAIADIQQANLTQCHREQLEAFGVKASIIAPILQDNQLWGLLIGHQCAQPRPWEQGEITIWSQLALQVGLALERVRLQTELSQARNSSDNQLKPQQSTPRLDMPTDRRHPSRSTPQVSELLAETQAALQNLQAKINHQSTATGDFLNQLKNISSQNMAIANNPVNSPPPWNKSNVDAPNRELSSEGVREVQKAIAEATTKVAMLNQSHQNLYQMVNLINEMKANIDSTLTKQNPPTQISMGEIIEAEEV